MQRDLQFLLDMLQSAELDMAYTTHCSKEEFLANVQLQDAKFGRGLSMEELSKFLNKAENSLYRECLLKHKLLFDIQLAFANQGRRLLIYESEYDQDGFDLIFDDLQCHKHFQVKSVVHPSRTSSFEIHRYLLRPSIRELSCYPLSEDSFGIGYGGGVLLIKAKPIFSNLSIDYYFVDGLILSAFFTGVFQHQSVRSQASVEKCFRSFADYNQYGGRVKVTNPCFIKFRSLSKLFSYCGFQIEDGPAVRHLLLKAVASKCGRHHSRSDVKLSPEEWRRNVHETFQNLICWEGLIQELPQKVQA